MSAVEIQVPDIGDFSDVPVIEIHVSPGDVVAVDDTLVTLESDKATLDVPSPSAGTVSELRIGVGDTVSQGSVLMVLEAEGAAGTPPKEHVHESAHPDPGEKTGYGSASGVYDKIEVSVPDIGDFEAVPVIEVLVNAGDTVAVDDPLITLESDKATMDVPAPAAGTVVAVKVNVGDTVSAGHAILDLRTGEAPAAAEQAAAPAPSPVARPPMTERGDVHGEVLVLGAGPGGYSAAFRAADLGKRVVLVDSGERLGGVCLNIGCIPSKALLHAAKVIAETKEMAAHGLSFADPQIDLDKLRDWKEGVVKRLTGGLAGLAKQRKVEVVRGTGRFTSMNQLAVTEDDGSVKTVSFEQAIIAAGSEPMTLPFIPNDDPRVIDSTGALELGGIPQRLLVLGGGIIGLEMATVYSELGAQITVVELMDQLIPGADKDIVAPLTKRITKRYESIYLKTRVTAVEASDDGLRVRFEGAGGAGYRHIRQGAGRSRATTQRPPDRRGERRRAHR